MKIQPINIKNHSNKRVKYRYNPAHFNGVIRPSKFFQTKGNLIEKNRVFWIDIKRNYNVYDFKNSGAIKNRSFLQKPILKQAFDFFELKFKNFHKVSDKYFRGGVVTCEYDILRLKKKGVTDIISLLEPSKHNKELDKFAKKQGIKYHHIELAPPYGIPTKKQIKQFFSILQNGTTYVHCLHGKDRTGIMTFLYEIEKLKVSPKKAIKNMMGCGLHAKRNFRMVEFLAQRYPEISKELKLLI